MDLTQLSTVVALANTSIIPISTLPTAVKSEYLRNGSFLYP